MIDKRIFVDTIMSSANPTMDRLDNKRGTKHHKNYQCNFADELKLDYKKGCKKIFRYAKDSI